MEKTVLTGNTSQYMPLKHGELTLQHSQLAATDLHTLTDDKQINRLQQIFSKNNWKEFHNMKKTTNAWSKTLKNKTVLHI